MIYLLGTLILMHGILHLLGFNNAFEIGALAELDSHISKTMGILWFSGALLLINTSVLIFIGKNNWWVLASVAVIFSQILIFTAWREAWFGTIANVIILIPTMIMFSQTQFENKFIHDVRHSFTEAPEEQLISESDLQGLPYPVQQYLRLSGVINTPRIYNMHLIFEGQMRQRGKEYFTFTSEQYNFFNEPARYFFMKADMFASTVPGYHRYVNGEASMDIRLFGAIPMVRHSGGVMNQTETVTFFNDICLFAPAALIDLPIEWREIDNHTVEATFHNKGIAVKAKLFFDSRGQLINFISNDRTDVNVMKQVPFSTPVSGYREVNGKRICAGGDAQWKYGDEIFTYGKFTVKRIEYNVKKP